MSQTEHDELEFLARARRGLSPSAGDAKRVLAALGPALLPAASRDDPALHNGSGPALASTAGTAGVSWMAVAAIAAAVGAGALGTGYFWGYRAGTAAAAATRPAPARASSPPTVEPPPRPESASLEAAPTAPRQSPSERLAPARLAPALTASSAAPAIDQKLEEETRQLARIERALRDENPRFALGLLGELDRNVPGGQLSEERAAARAMARCQLDADFAEKSLRDFTARYPGSAYLARVTELCAKGAPDSLAGETDSARR
jgi:hypothetical protein